MSSEAMSGTVSTDMSEFWNGEGGRKWVLFQSRIDASLFHFGEEVMSIADVLKGEKVLDIGCGCGDTTFEIAHRVGPFGSVHGVDISDVILEKTKNRSATYFNISFDCADAQSHPFKPKVFDLVFSRFGIMFFNNPIKAFSNIRKSLLPGGRIAFICWQPVKDNQWVNLPLQVTAKHVPLPAPPASEEPGAFSFGERSRVEHILSMSGFVDTLIESFNTKFNVGKDLDEAVMFLSHIGPASSVIEAENVNANMRSLVLADLRNALEPSVTDQGIELDAAAWIVTARID